MLFIFGKEGRGIVHWRDDPPLRQLLDAALTRKEIDGIYGTSAGTVDRIRDIVEAKIVNEANRINSGEQASKLGLENAQKIVGVIRSVGLGQP